MIKNIIFDIGGVLQAEDWDYAAGKLSSLKRISGHEFGLVIQKDRINHLDLYETGKISHGEYYSFVLNNLNLTNNKKAENSLRNALKNIWTDVNYDLIDLAQHLLVKKKLLLSNSFPELEENAKEKGYLKYFDTAYFSHRTGFKKPDKEIFLYTLEKERIKPEETIFVDNKEENTKAAEKTGIKAILYKSHIMLLAELKKYQLIK